jgi:hypothetical protein
MTAITRNPTNPNFLQPNKFILTFGRTPNVQYFCQSLSVPGISLSEVPTFNPFLDIYSPGEKAIYDLLNVTFIVDEELKSWLEIHNWIRAMTFPKDFTEYAGLSRLNKIAGISADKKPQFSDASIVLLSSSNTPLYRFNFHDVFPTSISTFLMNAMDDPDTIITADATFRYTYYDIEKLF